MKCYSVSLSLQYASFVLLFTDPPIRSDIEPLLLESWRKLNPDVQAHAWDMLLICSDIPTIPWIGCIQTAMGKIHCKEVKIKNNAKSTY